MSNAPHQQIGARASMQYNPMPDNVDELREWIEQIMQPWAGVNGGIFAIRGCALEIALAIQARPSTDAILEQAARVVEYHNRAGREWIPGSLWDTITREATARIRALKSAPPQPADAAQYVEALDVENHRLRHAMKKVMARLTNLLDEDQFGNIESIVEEAGVAPPLPAEQPSALPVVLTDELWTVVTRLERGADPLLCALALRNILARAQGEQA